jgi:hypothetical protein
MTADSSTGKQLETIHKIVCRKSEPYKQWWLTDWSETAAYLNSTFNLNLDAELEPLTRGEASQIITKLTIQ